MPHCSAPASGASRPERLRSSVDFPAPFTPTTTHQIASNTKLFTAVAAGLLVDEGKLTWDKPVRQSVPSIQFYDDELNNTITVRDMLSHRTGITRHDLIWYRSDDTTRATASDTAA